MLSACCFSLSVRWAKPETCSQIRWRLVVSVPQIMAQLLRWLMLLAKAIGKYLMNGYSVVKEQPIHRFHENGVEGFYPFTP